MNEKETNGKCQLCNDTGVTEYFEMKNDIPDGSYGINELLEKYGKICACPDCNLNTSRNN